MWLKRRPPLSHTAVCHTLGDTRLFESYSRPLRPHSAVASQGAALGATTKARSSSLLHQLSDAERVPQSLSFVALLAWAAWFGSTFYTTFILGIVLFKKLPRQTFRDVQEQLFPAFFELSALVRRSAGC